METRNDMGLGATAQRSALRGRGVWSAIGSLAGFGGLVLAAALPGVRYSRPGVWYRSLKKPPFTPPPAVFGPVWTGLYTLIAISGWRLWRRRMAPGARPALALWLVQLGLNAAWSPLFFGQRRLAWALADIVALEGAILACMAAARPVDRPASALLAPYAAWVGFAGLLNEEIVRRNG
ncbi:MAG TPA: TspO/MBR family protein [Polyangia bacterium]|nr:TspO/MBR family protein [Polyangia bacterium]